MREIKFRAWDKECKKWWYGEECLSLIMLQNRVVNKMAKDNDRLLERYTLMQYIWLKDKNKVEIYKGDLIKHNENIFQVKQYESGEFYLQHNENLKNTRDYFWIKKLTKYIKVVGNIYEEQ